MKDSIGLFRLRRWIFGATLALLTVFSQFARPQAPTTDVKKVHKHARATDSARNNENSLPSKKTSAATSQPSSPAAGASHQEAGDNQPSVEADVPRHATSQVPFQLDIWVDGLAQGQSKTIYMEQTDAVSYDPRVFSLGPGARKTVTAKVLNAQGGLVPIRATCDGCDDLNTGVNLGFSGRLKVSTEASWQASETYAVSIEIVDQKGDPLPLGADALIEVSASNARFSTDGLSWASKVALEVDEGSTSTNLVQVKPTSIVGRSATVSAVMYLSSQEVVLTESNVSIPSLPAWWFTLLMAVIGGLIPAAYRVVADNLAKVKHTPVQVLLKLITGAIAGGIAYLFANFDIIGVKLDTSSPRTFAILGFLFSYMGVDIIMKKITGGKESGGEKAAAARVP